MTNDVKIPARAALDHNLEQTRDVIALQIALQDLGRAVSASGETTAGLVRNCIDKLPRTEVAECRLHLVRDILVVEVMFSKLSMRIRELCAAHAKGCTSTAAA